MPVKVEAQKTALKRSKQKLEHNLENLRRFTKRIIAVPKSELEEQEKRFREEHGKRRTTKKPI